MQVAVQIVHTPPAGALIYLNGVAAPFSEKKALLIWATPLLGRWPPTNSVHLFPPLASEAQTVYCTHSAIQVATDIASWPQNR